MEKVITKKSTITKDAQREFKRRYHDLCDQLENYIADLKTLEQEGQQKYEYQVGLLTICEDEEDRSVIDVIRERRGLPRLSDH